MIKEKEIQLKLGDYESFDVINQLAIYKSDEGFIPPIPSKPIKHPPGSPEKIAEMRRRIERGQHLWHKDDMPASDPVARRAQILGIDFSDLS